MNKSVNCSSSNNQYYQDAFPNTNQSASRNIFENRYFQSNGCANGFVSSLSFQEPSIHDTINCQPISATGKTEQDMTTLIVAKHMGYGIMMADSYNVICDGTIRSPYQKIFPIYEKSLLVGAAGNSNIEWSGEYQVEIGDALLEYLNARASYPQNDIANFCAEVMYQNQDRNFVLSVLRVDDGQVRLIVFQVQNRHLDICEHYDSSGHYFYGINHIPTPFHHGLNRMIMEDEVETMKQIIEANAEIEGYLADKFHGVQRVGLPVQGYRLDHDGTITNLFHAGSDSEFGGE